MVEDFLTDMHSKLDLENQKTTEDRVVIPLLPILITVAAESEDLLLGEVDISD